MSEIDVFPWCGLCEPFSALSHWLGASVFAGLTIALVHASGPQRNRKIALAVLGVTTVLALLVSGMYHQFPPGTWREFFLRADVAGIFLLIAGCLTPVQVILLRGPWRWTPLALSWTIGLTGAILKLTVHPGTPGAAGILIFMLHGWCGVATAIKLWRRRGWNFVRLPVASGLLFTVGAVLLLVHQPTLWRGVIGPHEVWHVIVLCALALHWRFAFRIAAEANVARPRILPFERLPKRDVEKAPLSRAA